MTESGTFDGVFTSPTAPKSCAAYTPAPENLQYITIFDMEYRLPNT